MRYGIHDTLTELLHQICQASEAPSEGGRESCKNALSKPLQNTYTLFMQGEINW